MNSKIVALFALCAILFGCAFCETAHDGHGDNNNNGHGHEGWNPPPPHNEPTQPPTQCPPTEAPTHAPTHAATQAPTEAPTSAPAHTQAPTHAATQPPIQTTTNAVTQAPTHAPTQAPAHTQAPTHAATQAPTHAPTQAPTQAPTHAATQAPTHAPTQAPTHAATQAPTSSSQNLCTVNPTSSEPVKLLVPLYVDPGSAWTEVISAAQLGVSTVAIINPNSGPDPSGPDSSYVSYIQQLNNAGVEVVGYVHTSYGERAMSDVTADINTYATKYSGLKGIFIDEASADASEISYYTQVYNAITANSGYTNVILNPGTQPDQGYLAVSTNIVVFEDVGSNWASSSSQFSSWVKCAPNSAEKAGYKYRFSSIAYATSQSSMSSMLTSMENAGMGMVYLTDGANGCCTYNSLSSYFSTEASAIEAIN